MKVLITGVTGFLGRHLSLRLQKEGIQVVEARSRECDLTQEGALRCFNEVQFDAIYHLAAWTQAGDFCLYHPGEQWLINQKINTHMLAWWQQYQPQAKMICIGTSCSYDPLLPLREENYLQGLPIDSLFTYAMTKRMLLAGLNALHKQYGMSYLYLIPSTLYGPNYHEDGRQMHFIFDLVRKILRGKIYGEPVVLWGDGEQKRELIHVEDFIAVMRQLEKVASNTWVNVGGGEEYSIRQYAEIICSEAGYPTHQIKYDTTKYVGAKSKILQIEKLRKLLPQFVPRDLQIGIRELVQWFLQKEAILLAK